MFKNLREQMLQIEVRRVFETRPKIKGGKWNLSLIKWIKNEIIIRCPLYRKLNKKIKEIKREEEEEEEEEREEDFVTIWVAFLDANGIPIY